MSEQSLGDFVFHIGANTTDFQRKTGAAISSLRGGLQSLLSSVIAPLTAALSAKTFVQNMTADLSRLNELSKNLGVSAESISTWENAFAEAGAGVNKVGELFTSLNSGMQTAMTRGAGMMQRLVDKGLIPAYTDLGGEMKNVEDYAIELSDTLASMDSAQAAGIMRQLGFSDADTIDFMRQGSDAIREQLAAAQGLGIATAEDVKKAKDFEATLGRLSHSIKRALLPVFSAIVPIINSAASVMALIAQHSTILIPLIAALGAKLAMSLLPALMKMGAALMANPLTLWAAALLALGLLIEDFVVWLNGGESAIGHFLESWKKLDSVVRASIIALGALIAGTIAAIFFPVSATVAAIGALVVGAGLIIADNWDAIVEGCKVAWEWLCDIVGSLWNGTSDLLKSAWNGLVAVWNSITGALGDAWDWFCDLLKSIWDAIFGGVKASWDGITGIWDGIVGGLGAIWNGFCGLFGSAWNGAAGLLKSSWSGLTGAWDAVTGALGSAWDGVAGVFEGGLSGLRQKWDEFSDDLPSVWSGACSAITTMWQPAIGAVSAIWEGFTNGFSDPLGTLRSTWSGFSDGLSSVWNAATTTLGTAWNSFASALDGFFPGFSGKWSELTSGLSAVWDNCVGALRSVWDGFTSFLTSGIDWLLGKMDGVIGGVTSAWKSVKGFFGFGDDDESSAPSADKKQKSAAQVDQAIRNMSPELAIAFPDGIPDAMTDAMSGDKAAASVVVPPAQVVAAESGAKTQNNEMHTTININGSADSADYDKARSTASGINSDFVDSLNSSQFGAE